MTWLKPQSFESWLPTYDSPDLLEQLVESEEMKTAIHDLSGKGLTGLVHEHSAVFDKLYKYEEHLKTETESRAISRFWQSFLNMMCILFPFIWSTRTGDWEFTCSPQAGSLQADTLMERPLKKSQDVQQLQLCSLRCRECLHGKHTLPAHFPGVHTYFPGGDLIICKNKRTPLKTSAN